MVGPGRLELPTSRLSGVRSNHLSYGPVPPGGAKRHPARPTIRPGSNSSSSNSSKGRKRDEDGGTPPEAVIFRSGPNALSDPIEPREKP